VCPLLRLYTHDARGNVVLSIISQAYSVARGNLTQPILGIIIASALRVCGYDESASEKIKPVLLILIREGALWWYHSHVGTKGKQRRMRSNRILSAVYGMAMLEK
jgi:hypothetical protein